MGRPQADPSPAYNHGQPQSQPASNPQPQEYHYDQQQVTTDDVPPPPFEAYNDENHQETHQNGSSSDPNGSDKQNQQHFQPPPPPPTSQPQPPPQAYPQNPQPPVQPQPVRFPPQFPQANVSHPVSYPPQQNPQMVTPRTPPRNYPPQGKPQAYPPQAEPVQFPPPSPPSQTAYQASEPVQMQFPPPPPPPSQAAYHQPTAAAMQFPPPAKFPQQAQMGAQTNYTVMPPSPHKPAVQGFPVQNQYSIPQPQVGTEGWRTGLFDCMDDPGNALVTACFPCLTFGQIAEIIDNGHTSCATSGMLYGLIAFLIGMPCLISCTYRAKLRSRYGLMESPAPDWITHCFFEWCALCQEYRELQHRGLDPSIGWLGNMAKNQSMQQQQQEVAMVPPMNQTMMG